MGNLLFIGFIALSGAGLAMQVAMNGRLKDVTGSPALAAVINMVVGLILILGLLTQNSASLATLRKAPPWAFFGGLFGAVFVQVAAVGAGKVGPAVVMATAVFGQLVGAMALEHYGALGVEQHQITVTRIVGAALLFIGVLLVQSK